MFTGRSNSSSSDLSVRGYLPPKGKQRPATNNYKERKGTSAKRLDWNDFNSRPGTVPVNTLLDHNGPLAIESVSIPLSSRGRHSRVATPTKTTPSHYWKTSRGLRNGRGGGITKVNSLDSLSVKPLHHQYYNQLTTGSSLSATELQQWSNDHKEKEEKEEEYFDVPRAKSCTGSGTHSGNRGFRSQPRSQSQPKFQSRSESHSQSVSHSRSQSGSESVSAHSDLSDIVLDESVDQLSSEIDMILKGIDNGLILANDNEQTKDTKTSPLQATTGTLPLQRVKERPNKRRTDTLFDKVYDAEESVTKKTDQEDKEFGRSSNKEDTTQKTSNDKRRSSAAIKIQKWYRERQGEQRKARLQELLKTKRDKIKTDIEKQHSFNEEEEQALQEKQQRREAKMRAARQAAIEDLKKKREEKRRETEQAIAEEMAELEAKGKVNKRKRTTKKKQEETVGHSHDKETSEGKKKANESEKDNAKEEMNDETIKEDKKMENGIDGEKQVDEFFKAGKRKPVSPSPVTSPSHPPPPPPPVCNTMDSIYATLRELEEAPPPLPGVNTSPIAYLSAENLQKLDTARTKDSNKLQTILTYLDEVERSDPSPSQEKEGQPTGETGNQQVLNEQLEAASAVANDVTSTILTQRMEIENKNKTVEMLQKALNQQRELTVYHAKEMEKEAEKRLQLQKEEYETTIQRHQCFIDQLIDDKKVLSDKCEQLIKELKEMDKKNKTKITTMQDQHAVELEKQKQTYVAAEKVRRERWRAEETQRIKEATVKSLEPEIQRIIGRGKAEIQKLKAVHEAEMLQSDERVSRRFTQQIEELRLQHAQEKELACQHERELARQKYEQLSEQEERSYQQLRKKLYTELQQERDKLTAEMNGHNSALEKQIKDIKESHSIEIAELKSEHETKLIEIQRTHSTEFRDLQERTKIEKQMWEENYLKKQDATLMTRERELRENLRRERDMEIETVIQKLEKETAASKEETERAAESRIKRIREKYETELREVERSEKNTLQKFNTMKGQLSDLEGEVVKLRSHLRLKEEEVAEINEIATRLTRERDQFADVVRQEFADRLISVEEENRQMKLEVSELQAKQKLELERLQRGKERELAEVHNRVKQALAKKEENLRTLRTQHEAALKRADHLEMLLEQQRKELLKR